jgi:hypothetical protein
MRTAESPHRLRIALLFLGFLLAYGAYSAGTFVGGSASGEIVGSDTGVSKALGFDSCGGASAETMEAMWSTTNYYYVGAYIGGVTAIEVGCRTPNRTWFSEVHRTHPPKGLGWDFLPVFDGKQAPCSGNTHRFSADPTNSYEAARTEAAKEVDAAVASAENRGFTNPGSIIYYDLEAYEWPENPNCDGAARAYINVWVKRLHEKYGMAAGLYGSTVGSHLKQFWNISNKPNDAWMAEYGVGKSVYAINTENVPKEYWEQRRFHQYQAGATETHNGETITMDRDCAFGIVAGWGGQGEEPACQS